MPRFINPEGRSTFGIGICARCSLKFSLEDLYSDPNSPGLKVCLADLDQYDPYRLPAPAPDKITLRFYRPDSDLTSGGPIPNPVSLFGIRATGENMDLRITSSGDLRVITPIGDDADVIN